MDFVPHSLRDVPLQKSNVEWADIGGEFLSLAVILTAHFIPGLERVKRILRETLEWPTKYAPLFKQSPLRLRSG